jgi:hypothetical protein
LSQTLNKKVSKSHVKIVLRRRAQSQHATALAPASAPSRLVDWGTAADVPLFLGRNRAISIILALQEMLPQSDQKESQ